MFHIDDFNPYNMSFYIQEPHKNKNQNMNATYYIETMGCQMNKLDSELVTNELERAGYQPCDHINNAGIIIFNTCSVRQHAEEKVLSKIGQLRKRYMQKKDFVLAVIGCMAQRLGQDLLDGWDQAAIVCGPNQIHELVDLIEKVRTERDQGTKPRQARYLSLNDPEQDDLLEELDSRHQHRDERLPFMAFVRVMRGCNYFCSYCIVPYVRGRERSRPIKHIIDECKQLTDKGVKEITLLGQTINSYRYEDHDTIYGLADILESVHAIEGLDRIRFVTSYPRHFEERIFHLMASLPKVCSYLHLPAQSGSDRILKAMNRRYTVSDYIELIERGKAIVPELTVAGDFICGFPGEQESDHQATLELMRRIRYKNCFVFKYSPRPNTKAWQKMADDVPDDVKQGRLEELLALQHEIGYEDNQGLIGQSVEILVEGFSKNPHLDSDRSTSDTETAYPQLTGRTQGDQIVVFDGPEWLTGKLVEVKIRKASSLTLFGERYE